MTQPRLLAANGIANLRAAHHPSLGHHVHQGRAWLDASAEGENTAALAYAALELRFAVERLAFHYVVVLRDREPDEEDLRRSKSFKGTQALIFELGGHQREIDAHFAFGRIVLGAMKIDMPLATPELGKLTKGWHDCSELCHVRWTLQSHAADDLRKSAFSTLNDFAATLSAHVRSLGWPVLKEPTFVELRQRFIDGKATAADVLAHLQHTGIWARAEFPDGRMEFVGAPVPPNASDSA